MAGVRSLVVVMALTVGLAGCGFLATPGAMNESGVPTFGTGMGCAGVGLVGPMTVRLDPVSRPSVRLDRAGAGPVYWPPGTTVRTTPDVALVDDRGRLIAHDGQSFDSGGACVVAEDGVVVVELGDWKSFGP